MNRETSLALSLVGALLAAFAVIASPYVIEDLFNDQEFEGACYALDATKQGDVCIKDGLVVLTHDEFDKKKENVNK